MRVQAQRNARTPPRESTGGPRHEEPQTSPWSSVRPSGAGLILEDFLTFQLHRVAQSLHVSATRACLKGTDLGSAEWRVLALLGGKRRMSFVEIARRGSMDKAQVSRALRVLLVRGLISTVAQRGRSTYVSISPEGDKLYRNLLPDARKRQAELLRALTEQERTVLYGALKKLHAMIDSGSVGTNSSR